jgi:hypothetical protein
MNKTLGLNTRFINTIAKNTKTMYYDKKVKTPSEIMLDISLTSHDTHHILNFCVQQNFAVNASPLVRVYLTFVNGTEFR